VLGAPSAATVGSILANEPIVQQALAGDSVIGITLQGANYVNGASGTTTLQTSTEFVDTLTGKNAFTLGLLGLSAYGDGFQSLTVTVTDRKTTLLTKTFTTLASAQSYFADDALSLGTLSGNVNLTISTTLTATAAEGVSTDYVIGSAAAPTEALSAALVKTNAALQAAATAASMGRSSSPRWGALDRPVSATQQWRERLVQSQLPKR
jgi:hypothetical protein